MIRPPTATDHDRGEVLGREKAANEVAVHDPAQNGRVQVEHAGDRRHPPGVVDQGIHPAPVRVDRGGCGPDLRLVGDVRGDPERLRRIGPCRGDLLDCARSLLFVSGQHRDAGALLGQAQGERPAKSTARAGDHDDLVADVHLLMCVLPTNTGINVRLQPKLRL
jgi:hypothetical protein